MTLSEICKGIELQPQLERAVLDFADDYDFSEAIRITRQYLDFSKINDTTDELKAFLGEDEGNVKILACSLKTACVLYEKYKEKNISDKIFFDTMKCFTRFCGENLDKNGVLAFDREGWTGRQLGFHLFRIGVLEFEIKQDSDPHISVHIPSDALLEYENIKASFADAAAFFKKNFPLCENYEMRCITWMFSPEVRECLSEKSRIRIFGDFFELTLTGQKSNDFTVWLFGVKNTGHYEDLKEDTSLQKHMKKFLINGGALSVTKGILKKEFYKQS